MTPEGPPEGPRVVACAPRPEVEGGALRLGELVEVRARGAVLATGRVVEVRGDRAWLTLARGGGCVPGATVEVGGAWTSAAGAWSRPRGEALGALALGAEGDQAGAHSLVAARAGGTVWLGPARLSVAVPLEVIGVPRDRASDGHRSGWRAGVESTVGWDTRFLGLSVGVRTGAKGATVSGEGDSAFEGWAVRPAVRVGGADGTNLTFGLPIAGGEPARLRTDVRGALALGQRTTLWVSVELPARGVQEDSVFASAGLGRWVRGAGGAGSVEGSLGVGLADAYIDGLETPDLSAAAYLGPAVISSVRVRW